MYNDIYKLLSDRYDAMTGTGIFVPGHVKEDCLLELIRIVKPGMRKDESHGNTAIPFVSYDKHGHDKENTFIYKAIHQQLPNYASKRHIDGFVLDCSIASTCAMDILQFRTKPSTP